MKRTLTHFCSQRGEKNAPSFLIVYEWEDILAKALGIKVKTHYKEWGKWSAKLERHSLVWITKLFKQKKNVGLRFVMTAHKIDKVYLDCNVIPIIIDFWLDDDDICRFVHAYKDCPLVLVTNREVYDLLKEKTEELNVEHFPLSFPDQYALTKEKTMGKKYDFCMFGRPNPFFQRFLSRYSKEHPDFTYLVTTGDEHCRMYYTNSGDFVCEDTGRESYLSIIKQTRITCYSTPGVDESKKISGRFNQITPRVFEMLCNGCQVIGHYPQAADTLWYNISSVVPNVDTYDEFCEYMDKMRQSDFNFEKVSSFMKNHYTSSRVPVLKEILKKYNIEIE